MKLLPCMRVFERWRNMTWSLVIIQRWWKTCRRNRWSYSLGNNRLWGLWPLMENDESLSKCIDRLLACLSRVLAFYLIWERVTSKVCYTSLSLCSFVHIPFMIQNHASLEKFSQVLCPRVHHDINHAFYGVSSTMGKVTCFREMFPSSSLCRNDTLEYGHREHVLTPIPLKTIKWLFTLDFREELT